MLIKRSDLKLDKFTMLSCNLSVVPSKKKMSNEELKNVPVDLDFDILTNKSNSSKIQIMLEIKSNQSENPIPGYMFSVICSADYNIKALKKMPSEKQGRYILFTALPLAIAMVRSQLYYISSNFPHGHYLLPSIDLPDLFDKKYNKAN